MLNKVILSGRCGKDPEKRMTNSGTPVTSVTLAVDRDFKDKNGNKETDWIDVVAYRETANFLANYFTRGRVAIVVGRLQIRTWTDKEGKQRRTSEVVAENIYFGDSKNTNTGTNFDNDTANYDNSPSPASDFALLDGDDATLPF
jgi:single-strand DNA-binding protein